ncbi:hypothetical protein BDR05DRAFT_1005283 [Suillus weaverae]|nr:hypothetical protein BDR05DRAFT_1005283 [Suillus weaverae]
MELERIEKEKMEFERIEKEKMELETLQREKALRDHPVCDVSMDDGHGMDVDMPQMSQVTLSQSLAMEIEPGEIPSHSNAPCLYKGKGKAVDHRETLTTIIQSLQAIVLRPTETIFPFSGTVASHLLAVDHVPRFVLPITIVHARPLELEWTMNSQRITRVIAVEETVAHLLLIMARHQGTILQQTVVVSFQHRPSTKVSSVVQSIHGSLPFTTDVISIAASALNRMPPSPADTTTARWIMENTNCLKQFNLSNSLSSSLTSPLLQNRILHLICNPPYHLLNIISRGRLIVSKRTELRLRLWKAQYPEVPLWFFSIHCLSRGLDWQVFVNPHHLVGPLYGVPAPRPAHLNATVPLLNRMHSDVLNIYEDRVKSFLRLPFARRVFTKGGLLWRVAVHYGPDDLFLSALSGPSTDASIHRNVDCNGTDIDDTMTEDHINLLIGLTSDNHSLWPPLKFFEIYQLWEGEWSPTWETWFMERIAAIHSRSRLAFIHRAEWSKKPRRHTAIAYTKESTAGTEAHARRVCEQVDQLHPFMGSFTTLG